MLKIAHITDLHLRHRLPGTSSVCSRRSRLGLTHLREALSQAKRAHADLVAITGDLLDVPMFLVEGMPRGFQPPQTSEDWLELAIQDYAAVRSLLNQTGIPWIVLPGNHDWIEAFYQVFPQPVQHQINGFRIIPFHDHEHANNTPRRLGEEWRRFLSVLQDEDPSPQIHLQHYLFHQPHANSYPYQYEEADYMRRAIAESNRVCLTLSGHRHEGNGTIVEGGTHYVASPALAEFPYRWRLIEVDSSSVRTHEHCIQHTSHLRPAMFLDRDGVINDEPSYTWGPERFRLVPGSAQAIRKLNEQDIPVIVVTSQSCVGSGFVTESVLHAVHEQMHALLAAEGAHVDAVYYTTSAGKHSVLPQYIDLPTAKSSLLLQAAKDLLIDLSQSWIVGDRLTDIEAGIEAGTQTLLVHTGDGHIHRAEVSKRFPNTLQADHLLDAISQSILR
jgi:histidinol-phosphate phosphatase family protein